MTSSMQMGKSAIILGVSGVITQIFGFIYRIFLARMVSADVLGIFQLIMPVYSVALALTAVGLTAAVSQQTATLQAQGLGRSIRRLLYCCVGVFFALIAAFAVIVCPLSDQISVYVLGDARTRLGLLLLMPCLLLTGIENLHKHYFYGTGNVKPAALVEILEMVVRALAVLSLLYLFLPRGEEISVALIVCGMIICELFSSVTLVALARKDMRRRRLYGSSEGVKLSKIADIAIPVGLSTLAGTVMSACNSVVLPNKLVLGGADVLTAMSDFGVLTGMTIPLLNLPTSLIGALNLVLLPRLSESMVRRDFSSLARRLDKSIRLTVCTMMPAMTLIYLLGDDLGLLLFGQRQIGTYLAPLAIGAFFACLTSMMTAALNGLGEQRRAAQISVFCGGVQLLFTCVLAGIPGVGIWGYALGFLMSSVLSTALCYCAIAKQSRLKFQLFSWLLAPGLATLLMGLCVNLLHPILLSHAVSSGLAVLVSLVFGALLYFVSLVTMGIKLL